MVVLSPEQWDNYAPTNKHQLARAFAAKRSAYYVDVPGYAPTPAGRRARQLPPEEVHVVSVPGLPQRLQKRSGLATAAQAYFSAAIAAAQLWRDGFREGPEVLVYFPYPLSAIRVLRPESIVYHCVDHHASFPDLIAQREAIERREIALLEHADAVVATSPALRDHCRRIRPDTKFFPNVADVGLFGSVRADTRVAGAPPVLFFHGTFSEHKIDFSLLARLAASGSFELRLAGILPDARATSFVRGLESSGRVSFLGAMEQRDIVAEISKADVLVLPYTIGEHSRYVLPLKLVEYLATGLPVLSTRLPSIVESAAELVTFVGAGDDLEAQVRLASESNDALVVAKREFVSCRSWNTRVAEFESLFSEISEPKAAA